MKRAGIFILIALCILMPPRARADELDTLKIATTFYPMYILTINITDGIEGVEVVNMAQPTVGCLHDYTLSTGDMRLLKSADVLVINGAGMEAFLTKLNAEQPIPVIDSSAGIELIDDDDEHDEEEHGHEEEHDEDHDHEEDHEEEHDHEESAHDHAGHSHEDEPNAHLWMSPKLAIIQAQNIAAGLIECDPARAELYQRNIDAFSARIAALDAELAEELQPIAGAKIITSHPAFAYFARDYGLDVTATLAQEPGEMPATRDMARLVDNIRALDVKGLFVEQLYPEQAAEVLARETGIEIYELDSLTSGRLEKSAYEDAMRYNADVLLEALKYE